MTSTVFADQTLRNLEEEVRDELRSFVDVDILAEPGPAEIERVRGVISQRIDAYNRRSASLGEPPLQDASSIAQRILDDIMGLGVLQPLLDDPAAEEIIVNGPYRVFAIRGGRKHLTDISFDSDEALLALVRRAVGRLGRRLDETSPMVDARLADGSRLNAVIPPLTSRWTHVTIRKFLLRARTLEDLVELGSLPGDAASFLEACVGAGLNILISGGTGSGKTTCLNAMGSSIAGTGAGCDYRETAELQLESVLPDCVALQARPPNVEGAGAVSIRSLVKNALRMRPTRIIVGEVRGAEALDMLSAMNSGHEGSMCTIHANGPRQALSKLRMYAMMAEEGLPTETVAEMIAEAIHLVVHLRMDATSGRRVVSSVYEVTGLEDATVTGSEVFTLRDGALAWTGIRPRCGDRLPLESFPWGQ